MPQIKSPDNGWQVESLEDYFGLPTGIKGLSVISLFHRAYNLIWNERFRDENLQNSVNVPTGDGPYNQSDFKILPRCKKHDIFTFCLPFSEKTLVSCHPDDFSLYILGNFSDASATITPFSLLRSYASYLSCLLRLHRRRQLRRSL